MKKRAFTFAGLFISLIGLFLIIKNLSLTGFAISETINNSTSYLLPLVLFIGGILIATTGDGLQAWLERKEKEHASPSLEGKLQTPNEKKEFDRRYSGKHSFFKRLIGKRHVREVPQKERVSDGKEDYEGDKLHNHGYLIGQRKEELDRISKEISLARKDIFKYKSKMNEDSEKGETLMMASWVKGYTQAVDNLKQLYEQMSLSFPIDNYKKLKDAQAKKGFIRGLEELKKDIIENRSSFSPYTGKIPERFKGLQDLKEVEQLEQDLPKVQELIDLYIQGAKTVPVSELSRKYGVLVTHGISDLFKPKGHEDRGLMSWNVPGLSSEQRKNMDFKDYFKILIKDKPMISTATIIGSEIPLGPVGVILREGSVYDAEPEDLMAKGEKGGNRFRKGSLHSNQDINERVEFALRNKGRRNSGGITYNELIVGGDYQIGGLYLRDLVLDKLSSREAYDQHFKDLIRETAELAVSQGLPLYRATEGKGLEPIKPQDYLPQEKPATTRKYANSRAISKKRVVAKKAA